MDGEASPMSGGSQRADKRSYKDLKIDMEEQYLDFEESSNKKLHEVNSGAWLVVRRKLNKMYVML